MVSVTHLRALQALEMAVRAGSLAAAATRLGITPAAVGQRIRALEDHLGTSLLARGPSGLRAGPELAAALDDLRTAFTALERATLTLDFQRACEIHIVADPDWAELWLMPRIGAFRAAHPNILFCINGVGDVPLRLGAPDLRIACADTADEPLFRDILLPVTGPDNTRRILGAAPAQQMEGMPLLHLRAQREGDGTPGWEDWFGAFGRRERGRDRGIVYPNARLAIPAARRNVGFLFCGLSFLLEDLAAGTLVLPFAPDQHLPAPQPYRLALRHAAGTRPQIARFADWLRDEARRTEAAIRSRLATPRTPPAGGQAAP